MKSARAIAKRAQTLSSSPPGHAAHLPTCVQLPQWTNAEVCSRGAVPSETPFPSKPGDVAGRAE